MIMKNTSVKSKITVWVSALTIIIAAFSACAVLLISNNVIQSTTKRTLINAVEGNINEIRICEAEEDLKLDDKFDISIEHKDIFIEIDDDFIKEKEIAIDDRGDTVFVSFVLDSAEIVADITEKDSDHLPKIYGSMELEKETGNVLHFEYNFGQYLLDALMKAGEDKPNYKADVKDFTVEGRILNTELEDLTLDRSFVEYTDENKADFIVAFLKHMIPFYEEEG